MTQQIIDPVTNTLIRINERLPIPLDMRILIIDIIKDACEIARKQAVEAYKKSEQFDYDAAMWAYDDGWEAPR